MLDQFLPNPARTKFQQDIGEIQKQFQAELEEKVVNPFIKKVQDSKSLTSMGKLLSISVVTEALYDVLEQVEKAELKGVDRLVILEGLSDIFKAHAEITRTIMARVEAYKKENEKPQPDDGNLHGTQG